MLLHDSFFYSSNRSSNATHYIPIILAHSPLFHSTLTLIISIFGTCSNLICIFKLCFIISQYKQRKLRKSKQEEDKSIHLLSHKKYHFLLILTSNNFLLCLSSIISCLDEKYFFQSLIARYHSCSFHILIWKFTLHFIPLLTIFILFRYHYLLNKKFPLKSFHTTAMDQLLCTDLCLLIPFVLALACSVDGLWLWGVTNLKNFVTPSIIDNEQNQTNEISSSSSLNRNIDQLDFKLDEYYDESFYLSEQKIICYLQTNDDLNLTTRLLHLIQADFLLLFSLHLFGLFLGILLHIRLCCCLTAGKLTSSFLREQQLSLYILYIFICLTLTSLPFYFYRSFEILFDPQLSSYYHDLINSRIFAQILLFGTSFNPILYFILLCPSNILFKFKCYTSFQIDTMNQLDNILLSNQHQISNHNHYSLRLSSFYPKIHIRLRELSRTNTRRTSRNSFIRDCNQEISDATHV